jgi:hypothetical protein
MEYVLTLLLILPTVALYGLIGFAIWRVILSNSYERIGWRPLGVAYLLFPATLFVSTLLQGLLGNGGYYLMILFGTPLTLITLAGVPAVALLVRSDRLGYGATVVLIVLHALVAAVVLYEQEFMEGLLYLTPAITAFFLGLAILVGRRQRQQMAPQARAEPSSGP